MHSIKIHKVVGSMISLFYKIGVWHRGDKPTVKEIRLKLFYCIYHLLCVLSMVVGAITNEKSEMSIYLAESSIAAALAGIKLWFLMSKQHQILNLLEQICVFTVKNDDDYKLLNDKLGGFMRFVLAFLISAGVCGFSDSVILSFLGPEKTLFLEIAFPLNYKISEIAFWIATFFLLTSFLLELIGIFFSVIIWCFLLICSLRFEVLGNSLKNIGKRSEPRKGKLKNIGDTALEHVLYVSALFYFIADIFMITYLGNEIMLSSDSLSYNLFESNWYDQPQSTKKNIIVFGEYLKQPKQLLVGKLYPLTLETFTRILKSACSMFNILKSFQQ